VLQLPFFKTPQSLSTIGPVDPNLIYYEELMASHIAPIFILINFLANLLFRSCGLRFPASHS